MSNILVVFGATGHQGKSVIQTVLHDPTLSQTYKIRAVVRDPSSAKAQALGDKVEVVQGDLTDRESVSKALTGAHTVFFTTVPSWDAEKDRDFEWGCGTTVADLAVAQGLQYIVFSTLPAVNAMSGGKYSKVTVFDVKAEIEDYIRKLPIKSAFVSLANYMENFEEQFFLKPQLDADGNWVVKRSYGLDIKWPLIAADADTGKWVGAILAEPEKFEGKRLHCATQVLTYGEVIALLEKSAGKKIVYQQVSKEEFREILPALQDVFIDMAGWVSESEYFGPGQEGLVEEAKGVARGKLTTFEEFLEKHPFTLDA
ncbi:NAD(P)-binding protein [Periconia macrospinosa]|uniref:NAD(P)-binding protein n=1 Tax=Periconia macrospinosa TaxID=97972 RepID=A0A2V1DER8_9PLEO|nr:NAD(P)-binding protein [Periconia macrospinosa]